MNDRRLWAIVRKEWLEIRKHRALVMAACVMPLAMVASAIGMMTTMLMVPESEWGDPDASQDMSGMLSAPLRGLEPQDALLVQTNDMMLFMILMVPMILPTVFAAYSIIGEKEGKSLEPLLATPISTTELLLGKTISAALPATVLGWLSYALIAVFTYFMASPVVFAFMVRPVWIIGIATLSPLLALLATMLGVMVSSRSKDPRSAQQVAGVIVLPVVGAGMAVMFGKMFVSLETILWSTAVLTVLVAASLAVAVRLFRREAILTKWK